MNYTDFLSSAKGDIYQISLSSKNGGLIADDVRQSLSTEGIVVMDVELNRVQGLNPTTNAVLSKKHIMYTLLPAANISAIFHR